MEQFMKDYMSIIRQKHEWNKKITGLEFWDPEQRIKNLIDEVQEVSNEIKLNNQIYLEDELWDIFRDYMNLLILLQERGYISNPKEILFKSYEKFHERISAIINKTDKQSSDIARDEVKKMQKKKLKNQHNNLYK